MVGASTVCQPGWTGCLAAVSKIYLTRTDTKYNPETLIETF